MLTADQQRRLQQRLNELQQELTATIAASEKSSQTVELDQSLQGRLSRMDAIQGQAMAKATLERATRRLKQSEQTLRRLADEDFGLCLDCDEPIPFARLEFDPTTRHCITCAEMQES